MKYQRLKSKIRLILFSVIFSIFCLVSVKAQSTNIEFPTPVTTNEISGKIAARDVGDSRLTTHYYFFNGTQGDISLKISTSNLDGDIDIFIADTLRPITKISVFSDSATESGREIYLRKPEKLILRVEGRTPTDDAATYSIKFEGSFLAVAASKNAEEDPKLTDTKPETEEGVKVNSVGTIIKTPPKKTTPTGKTTGRTTVAKTPVKPPVKAKPTPKPDSTVEEKTNSDSTDETKTDKKEVVITDNLPKETTAETTEPKKTVPAKTGTAGRRTTRKTTASTAKTTKPPVTAPKPTANEELTKALENIKLVILFKDDTKIERPMNEILRVNVDKGVLTVISKDGIIKRYSILDITKMSIE